jgi:hypothetical protein
MQLYVVPESSINRITLVNEKKRRGIKTREEIIHH